MKNIGLLSDLHLEGSNMELVNPGWDYLVIAGDLSSELSLIQHFFAYQAPTDIPVIYVLGNHEYEGRTIDKTADKIRELIKPFENVHLLDNESIVFDGIKFIGTTLWSNFELNGMHAQKEAMKWAKFNVVDFSATFMPNDQGKYVTLSPEYMAKMNEKACDFLEFELRKNPFEGQKIVVSHFAPHPLSIHSSRQHLECSYWVNNLEHLMGFSDYWFHGHTHDTFNYQVEGTHVICNPRGFSKTFNLSPNAQFDKTIILPAGMPTETKKLKP